jgi:hypothetical protein
MRVIAEVVLQAEVLEPETGDEGNMSASGRKQRRQKD